MCTAVYEDEKFLQQRPKQENVSAPAPAPAPDKQAEPPLVLQTERPVQLILGVPSTAMVDTTWSWQMGLNVLQKQLPPNTGVIPDNSYGIATSREVIVDSFLKTTATHLLFIDSDIYPLANHAITTLINDTLVNKDCYMVSGCYYNSLPNPNNGLAAWKNGIALKMEDPNDITNTSKDPLIQVDLTGMGFFMIKRELFNIIEDMDRPLFFYKIGQGGYKKSEDFYFQERIFGKYGIKPYLDNRVLCNHIKRVNVGPKGEISY